MQKEKTLGLIDNFIKKGQMKMARSMTMKLIEKDKKRIVELGSINITKENYSQVMQEMRDLFWLYS